METIKTIPAKLVAAVAEAREAIEMERMAQTVRRFRRQHLERLENGAKPQVNSGPVAASLSWPSQRMGRREVATDRMWPLPRAIAPSVRLLHHPSFSSGAGPTDVLVDPLIRHFLYEPKPFADDAASGASLAAALDPLKELDAIATMTMEEWQTLIDRYVLQTPCAAVVGLPSAAKAKAISDDDEKRQKAQVEAPGAEWPSSEVAVLGCRRRPLHA